MDAQGRREGAHVHAQARPRRGIPRASRSTSARRRSSSASPPTAPSTAARSAATPSRRTSPARTGKSAVGLKVKRGKLYVAGGGTGSITVYDIATKAQVAKFETGSGGFLNDLQVTRNGDVYVTDSFARRSGTSPASRWRRAPARRRAWTSAPSRTGRRRVQPQRHRGQERAQARGGRHATAASCTGSSSAMTATRSTRSTRSRAPPCPAATACCWTTDASSWSRATRPSSRS